MKIFCVLSSGLFNFHFAGWSFTLVSDVELYWCPLEVNKLHHQVLLIERFIDLRRQTVNSYVSVNPQVKKLTVGRVKAKTLSLNRKQSPSH